MFERAPESSESELAPSAATPARPVLAQGEFCGRYRVVRLLARGGMSEVFEAVHVDLLKPVALKVLSPALRSDREANMRFTAEARTAACLVHSNIVDVLDCGVVDGLPYLVTNLMRGCDLATYFARRRRLPPSEVVDILWAVADAIAFGHRHGVTHRDLKPENIFLHEEGARIVPKVLDFGIARMSGTPRITAEASVIGTPHYMAPEQARAEKSIGPAADQYALGVMLYEGLTGCLPRNFEESNALLYAVAYGSFPPPSKFVRLPPGLEAVVLRAMAADPARRYRSMRALAAALLPYTSPRVHDGVQVASGQSGLVAARASGERPVAAQAPSPAVLDLAGFSAILGEHKGLVALCVAGMLTLSGAGMWLYAQSQGSAPGAVEPAGAVHAVAVSE